MKEQYFPLTDKEAKDAGVHYSSESKRSSGFASRLRKLRGKTLSQAAAAKAIGVTKSSLSLYENGDNVPDARTIRKMSEVYGVSADYLLGLSDAPTSDKDLSFVCSYTGLSQEAILFLRGISVDFYRYFIDFVLTKGGSYLLKAAEDSFGAVDSMFRKVYAEKTEMPSVPITHSDGKSERAVFYDLDDAFDFYAYRARDSFGKIIDSYLGFSKNNRGDSDAE